MTQHKQKLYWQFAGSLCLSLFMILGYLAKFYENTLLTIDQPFMTFIEAHRYDTLTSFFKWITKFGNTSTAVLLVAIIALMLLKYQKKVEAIWLILNTAIISGLGKYLIKFLFERPRPGIEHLIPETHFSFPSGHAMIAVLLYGTLIFLVSPYAEKFNWAYWARIILGILILLIGVSRIYLGVHYPTDILGGYLVAASWLCFSYPIFARYRFKQFFKVSP